MWKGLFLQLERGNRQDSRKIAETEYSFKKSRQEYRCGLAKRQGAGIESRYQNTQMSTRWFLRLQTTLEGFARMRQAQTQLQSDGLHLESL